MIKNYLIDFLNKNTLYSYYFFNKFYTYKTYPKWSFISIFGEKISIETLKVTRRNGIQLIIKCLKK